MPISDVNNKIYGDGGIIERQKHWNRYFFPKADELVRDAMNATEYKRCRVPEICSKEIVPVPGKVLTLKNTVLNYLHFNFRYRNSHYDRYRPGGHTEETLNVWTTYINCHFAEEIICVLDIPETLKDELIDATTCSGCIMGALYKADITFCKEKYRLRLNPNGSMYEILDQISMDKSCIYRELWIVLRDHGVITGTDDLDELHDEIYIFLERNLAVVQKLGLKIPSEETLMAETIRYSLGVRPRDIRAKTELIPPEPLDEAMLEEPGNPDNPPENPAPNNPPIFLDPPYPDPLPPESSDSSSENSEEGSIEYDDSSYDGYPTDFDDFDTYYYPSDDDYEVQRWLNFSF